MSTQPTTPEPSTPEPTTTEPTTPEPDAPEPTTAAPTNRAARRAAKKGKKGDGVDRAAPPGTRSVHERSAQGRRVNPIRRTGS